MRLQQRESMGLLLQGPRLPRWHGPGTAARGAGHGGMWLHGLARRGAAAPTVRGGSTAPEASYGADLMARHGEQLPAIFLFFI